MRYDHITFSHWLAMAAGASDRALDRRLVRHGSTRTTWRILSHLAVRKQETQADLGRLLGITAQTASDHVRRLEIAETIQKYPDPYDRRSHIIEITEHGRRVAAELQAVSDEHERMLLAYFDPAEVLRISTRLARLVERLDAEESTYRAERREALDNRRLDELLARRRAADPDLDDEHSG
ncbi:MarR family winged helix-turn-helix transcriptional regulator [Pseudonocardia sp. WMMC193]|uniref:MarR family winged helix-turn-helix transcriptional regulator n=1 Tax=Pseudonocardia sp. WMMC193 TaxID=2911965 RepID=UPI001F4327D4|nr:MarR family winged helix-turn-helix transcriptional regulator [Pseudonocardia sp. WMMC193]MCF7549011.1 MarR family winged helix-turn-helix transcriptional regulator [Pseudonocardia sp. WMMC193]